MKVDKDSLKNLSKKYVSNSKLNHRIPLNKVPSQGKNDDSRNHHSGSLSSRLNQGSPYKQNGSVQINIKYGKNKPPPKFVRKVHRKSHNQSNPKMASRNPSQANLS